MCEWNALAQGRSNFQNVLCRMLRFQLHPGSFRECNKEGNLRQEGILTVQLQNGFGVNLSQMGPSYRAADSSQPLRAVLPQMVVSKLGKPGKLKR